MVHWVSRPRYPLRPLGGQVKDQSHLPEAGPGRFTGAVFVADNRGLGTGFTAAQAKRPERGQHGLIG